MFVEYVPIEQKDIIISPSRNNPDKHLGLYNAESAFASGNTGGDDIAPWVEWTLNSARAVHFLLDGIGRVRVSGGRIYEIN